MVTPRNRLKGAGISYLGAGAAFFAVSASGQPAFLGVGLAFIELGILRLRNNDVILVGGDQAPKIDTETTSSILANPGLVEIGPECAGDCLRHFHVVGEDPDVQVQR